MIQTAQFYYFYHNILVQLVKLLIVVLLIVWGGFISFSGNLPTIPLFFLSIFIMFETFFYFSLSRTLPVKKITDTTNDVYETITIRALYPFVFKTPIEKRVQSLFKTQQGWYFLEKMAIDSTDIPSVHLEKNDLLQKAYEVAKQTNGIYVTTVDVIAAYFLLIEPTTKLLFNHQLKEEDILHIAFWTRQQFPDEEKPHDYTIHFWGEGIGDAMVSGWTVETQKYTIDITSQATQQGLLDSGREDMLESMTEALATQKKSVLLVGEPGVGKVALINSFIYESFLGDVPRQLKHKKLFELLLDRLLAGSTDQGNLEGRLEAIIDEVSHANTVLLYIPNFENIVGASTFNVNLAGALLPYLEKGNLQIIATATTGNYKKYIAPLKEFATTFATMQLAEPDLTLAMQMLLLELSQIEDEQQVFISYKAALKAISLAKTYMPDSVLPGAAVRLLEETAGKVVTTDVKKISGRKIVTEADVEKTVEDKSGVPVSAPTGKEKQVLLNLEKLLHQRIIAQDEAIKAISEAIRRIRTGLSQPTKPISFLFLGPTGVGKTETAKTLSDTYFKGEHEMLRFDMSEYTNDDGVRRLLGAAPGQGDERGELTDKIHDHPFSLVLLDEFEKADKRILDLFLQVFDDGRLTDNKGQTVSFSNCIIIATSNAGAELIRESVQTNVPIDASFQQKLLDYLQKNGVFKPELLNRFDGVIVFKPLTQDNMKVIVQHMLGEVNESMKQKDITVTFDDKVMQKLVTEGANVEFGARPLRRYIQDNIEDLLAKKMLSDEIRRGSKVVVTTDEKNNITTIAS